eukprot:2682003-Pyramimonas_sp.AAC.1
MHACRRCPRRVSRTRGTPRAPPPASGPGPHPGGVGRRPPGAAGDHLRRGGGPAPFSGSLGSSSGEAS